MKRIKNQDVIARHANEMSEAKQSTVTLATLIMGLLHHDATRKALSVMTRNDGKSLLVFVFTAVILSAMIFPSCNTPPSHSHEQHDNSAWLDTAEYYYTCSMHPTVKADKQGDCPICFMPLVKTRVQKGNIIELTEREQMLANIKTTPAVVKPIFEITTLLGTAAIDEKKVSVISSRVKGRLEKLFFRNPGDKIKTGEALYEIYSEQLLADEKEFVSALALQSKAGTLKETADALANAAGKKLRLWGMTEKQIQELADSKVTSPYITYFSPVSGAAVEIFVSEGEYVKEGTPLIKVADLATVWVEAQLYPNEFSRLENMQEVEVEFEAYPNEIIEGKVVQVNPSLERDKRINLIKIEVANPGQKFYPGMMAYVYLKSGMKKTLVVPKSAVLMEKMKVAWVKTGQHTFEQRMVETGMENKWEVEILSGLAEGDSVVSSGVYLINSEYIIKRGAGQRHGH